LFVVTVTPAVSVTGVPKVDVADWVGGTVPAVNIPGVPLVDLKYTLGTISPATAGSVRADAVTGAAGSVTGAVGSVTAGVTVTTNNDKTGYSLTQTFPTNFSSLSIDSGGNVKLVSNIKKNQALAKFEFLMTDSTNHNPKTGLTVTVTRSIDGGAFAAGTLSVVTEVANGIYSVDFGAGDLNGNVVTFRATATAADDLFVTLVTDA
jgi:hypothetical protein